MPVCLLAAQSWAAGTFGALLLRVCVRKLGRQHDSSLCTLRQPLRALQDERKAEDGSVPGFGQLHPRTQGVTTLGTIYSSSLFPERCPPGMFLMLNYIGGATNRGILQQSKEDIVAQVRYALPLPAVNPRSNTSRRNPGMRAKHF